MSGLPAPNLRLQILDRTFTNEIAFPGVTFKIERFSFDADWGPKDMQVTVEGEAIALRRLLLYLRCRAVVRDGMNIPRWWGLWWATEIQVGSIKYGLTLDEFADKINVIYLQQTI